MNEFKLKAPYKPTGDQPQAIEALVKGFQEGNQCQTLLGVTGSGKTFTMANVPIMIITSRKLMFHPQTRILPRIQLSMKKSINFAFPPLPHCQSGGTLLLFPAYPAFME